MKLFLTKIALLLIMVQKVLFAQFLTGNAVDVGKINDIKSQYGDKFTEDLVSGTTDFIFNDSAFSEFWEEYGTFAAGAVELCYTYKSPGAGANPNICSIFSNVNVNPCDSLPATVGNFTKNNSSNFSLSFRDWCEQAMMHSAQEASEIGLSGKKSNEIGEVLFNSDKMTSEILKGDNIFKQIDDSNLVKETRYNRKVNLLKNSGNGVAYYSEVRRVAKRTESVSFEDVKAIKPKPIFKDIKEYRKDTNAKAKEDDDIQRQLFDMNRHLNIADGQFGSMNNQDKSLKEKSEYIESYIEGDEDGLRKQYHKWAESKATAEIMYELPKSLGEYKVFFDNADLVDLPGYKRDAKVTETNYQIIRQQHMEEQIMIKWRQVADARADTLKVRMYKHMYASEIFDEQAARDSIESLLN